MRLIGIAGCMAAMCISCIAMAQASAAPEADGSSVSHFAAFYADSVLEDLGARSWLFTDGLADDAVVSRAAGRGASNDVVLLQMRTGSAESIDAFEKAARSLGDPVLEAAAYLGAAPFALVWMERRPDEARRSLAFVAGSTLAGIAGFVAVPSGMTYELVKPGDVTPELLKAAMAKYMALRDSVGEMIAVLPGGEQADAMKRQVAAHVATGGNNLGVLLYRAGMTNEAFNAFSQAYALDRANASALLNMASVVRDGFRPELAEKISADLNELARNNGGNWTLASTCGYVLKPEHFAEAKWFWAFSGISAADTNGLARAMSAIGDDAMRNIVAQQLPLSFAVQTGGAQPAMLLLREMPDGPVSWNFMLKIADLHMMLGDRPRALRAADRAAGMVGADAKAVAFAKAGILCRMGRHVDAVQVVEKIRDKENSTEVVGKIASIYADVGNNAKLLEALKELAAADGAPAWIETAAGGVAALVANDIPKAKELMDKAVESGADADFAYRPALLLDLMTGDRKKAAAHADAALKISPMDHFANYVKATVLVEAEEYQQAERHFQLSISQSPAWFVMNDYAAMANTTKRFEFAEMMARNALSSGGSQHAAVWDTLAAALVEQGKTGEALEALKRAVSLPGRDDPRIQLRFAELSLEAGDAVAAEKAVAQVDKRAAELSVQDRERLGKVRRGIQGKKD